MRVVELVVGAILFLAGVRSLIGWLTRGFEPRSAGEQLLYALYGASRAGLWFAFAGVFAGYALVDEPQEFRWAAIVPLALAGIQMITGMMLARSPSGPDRRDQ